MPQRIGWFCLALIAVWQVMAPGSPALAEPAGVTDDEKSDAGHRFRFGLGLQLGSGFRAISPFDDEYCGDTEGGGNASTCLGRTPFQLGVIASYGVSASVEVIAEIALGLEKDFGASLSSGAGPRLIAFAPGIRGYLAEVGPGRVFATLQFWADFADYAQRPGNDYGIRNLFGVLFDVHDQIGAYVYVGENIAWERWLSFGIEGGIGVQGRLP